MLSIKKLGVVIVLFSVVASCLAQISQGKPHGAQVGAHETQGGVHKSQGGVQESQGGAHESQRGGHKSQEAAHDSQEAAHDSQEAAHDSQGGAHESQDGPQEIQGRVRRQVPQGVVDWVACDFTAPSKISCYDCNTRVICKPVGGILKPCSPKKPFCKSGVCSAVPTGECA